MKCKQLIEKAQLIVLDFDGVVVDSEGLQLQAWHAALKGLGIQPKEPLIVAGRLDEEIAMSLVGKKEVAAKLVESKKKEVDRILGGEKPPLVSGVREFVEKYSKKRYLLAITSNSSQARVTEICDYYGLTKYFKVIVAASGRCAPKPSSEIYNIALQNIGIPSEKTVAIEDSLSGIVSAKRAGIAVIGLLTSLKEDQLKEEADCVVQAFHELM